MKPLAVGNVPEKRRAAAIQLELASWTPFPRTGHYVIPQGVGALAVAWDQDAVDAAQARQDILPGDVSIVPETALQDSLPDGLSLCACLDGLEAVWVKSGCVEASQWWPEAPDPIAFANFQRAAGIAHDARAEAPPVPMAPHWRPQPVGYAPGKTAPMQKTQELSALALLSLILVLPTIWYANDWRRHAFALHDSQMRLADTEKELNGLLGARGVALGSRFRLEKLNELLGPVDSLQLFALVARQLQPTIKASALQLTEWEWRNKRLKCSFVSSGAPPSATALVKALESQSMFRDVQVAVDGTRVTIDLRVEPSVSPSAGSANVSPPISGGKP